jgi:hypothetical protein
MGLEVPYVPIFSEKVCHSDSGDVWAAVLHNLTTPPDENASEFAHIIHRYQYLCFAELIRRKWDSKFRVCRVPRGMRPLLNLDGELWLCLLNLISETFLVYPAYKHPALWFNQILGEHEIFPTVRHFDGERTGKAEILKLARSENHSLLTLESNLFHQEGTKLLFDCAMEIAEVSDRFRAQTYMPFVRARQKVVTYAAQHSFARIKTADGFFKTSRQRTELKKVNLKPALGAGFET